jgi:hypothetical protein
VIKVGSVRAARDAVSLGDFRFRDREMLLDLESKLSSSEVEESTMTFFFAPLFKQNLLDILYLFYTISFLDG